MNPNATNTGLDLGNDTVGDSNFGNLVQGGAERLALATSLALATIGFAKTATAEEVRVALNGNDGLVEMMSQEEGLTHATLKEFMDEGLHAQIDTLSEDTLSYMKPMMDKILTIENERYRNAIARGIIAVFLAPNVEYFDRAVSRFDKVGLSIDENELSLARIFIENEELKIMRKRGDIILALTNEDERIAEQQKQLNLISALIIKKELALSEERGALSEERGALSEERGALSEERGALSEERGALSEERGALSEERLNLQRLYSLRDEILQNIEEIRAEGERKTG